VTTVRLASITVQKNHNHLNDGRQAQVIRPRLHDKASPSKSWLDEIDSLRKRGISYDICKKVAYAEVMNTLHDLTVVNQNINILEIGQLNSVTFYFCYLQTRSIWLYLKK